MAKRLKTRLSAGAALVTGLSAFGVGLMATPAQAATVTQQYECTYSVLNIGEVEGDPSVSVELTADIPAEAETGDVIESAVTATVTIPDSRRDSLYGLLAVRSVDGPNAATAAAEADSGLNAQDARNQATFTISDGTESADGVMPLEVPMTDVPASGELVVTATGAIEPTELTRAGEYTITAGDFQAYIRGYGEDGGYKTNVTLNCTNVSENPQIATVSVTEGSSEPTSPDPSDPSTTPEPTDPSTTPEPTDPSTTPEPTDPSTTPE
ncbi:hypothetical protein ACTHQ1_09895, partial [Janibacter anophelis]|uniref:hypothetical protein n=1 Tax=Janibacter anophelis TaxID=319054 RepID=UPI003F7E8B16